MAFSFSTIGVEESWSVSTSSMVALVLILSLGNRTMLQCCFLPLRGMEFRGLNCCESFES